MAVLTSLRAVHFDDACVVIPDPKPKPSPRMGTRTVSLPLWKTSPDAEPTAFQFKLPMFSKPKPSPKKAPTLPSPCLRVPGQPPHPGQHAPPSPIPSSPIDPDLVKVPLAACCPDCLPAVEQALCVDYKEHFSAGARRRRRASSASSGCTTFSDMPHLRVDELQERVVEEDETESDYLFPLPCSQRPPAHKCHEPESSGESAATLVEDLLVADMLPEQKRPALAIVTGVSHTRTPSSPLSGSPPSGSPIARLRRLPSLTLMAAGGAAPCFRI